MGQRKVFAKNPTPGISDLIVLLPKITLWAELKRPKGVQSPEQKKFEAACRAMDHHYVIWRSIEDCQNTLKEFEILAKV